MSLTLRLRDVQRGEHVHTTVFARWEGSGDTFQNLGTLIMDKGQWQLFGAALLVGAQWTKGHLHVETTDQLLAIAAGGDGPGDDLPPLPQSSPQARATPPDTP